MKWQTHELYLRQLMAQKLEIPVLGELHFAIPAGSTTSLFEEYARTEMDIPAELISVGSAAPANAFGDCSAYRNDVVLVFPGAYDLDARLAWDKDMVHMTGMAGPNNFNLHTDPGCNIYTDTENIAETIDVTGDKCQFHDFLVGNVGNHAGNLAALTLDSIGCTFKNVMFMGAKNPLNAVVETACSLSIVGGGDSPIFEDCVIGDNNGSVRATAEHTAALRFTSDGYPMNGLFRRCRFNVKSSTAGYHHAVYMGSKDINKQWIWDDCHFYNYDTDNNVQLAHVFWDVNMTTHSVLLHNCTMQGFDKWQHGDLGDAWFGVSMPIAATAGGIVLNPTSA